MKRIRMFLAPLALLSISAAACAESERSFAPGSTLTQLQPAPGGWQAPIWRQVRIERRFSIRITPGTANMPPWVIEEIEEEQRVERVPERKIDKCLAINSIAALRAGDGGQLLLFLRDQRIVSATLEKRCSARDFYAGFYIERNADGAICAGRDLLQSRSGANCKVRRMKELVPTGYRRFP